MPTKTPPLPTDTHRHLGEEDTHRHLGEGEACWIPLSKLRWGPENPYQRDIRPHFVEKIVDNFSARSLGVLEVALRRDGNGFYWVKDGQHRCEAVTRMPENSDDPALLCHVIVNESIEEEAADALQMNMQRKGWTAHAAWRAELVRKNPLSLAIRDMLDGLHIVVRDNAALQLDGSSTLVAIGAVVRLCVKPGGLPLCDRALNILNAAWPGEPEALSALMLDGMSIFLAEQGEFVDNSILIKTLKRSRRPALDLLEDAHSLRRPTSRCSQAVYVALAVEHLYNSHQRTSKLPARTASTYKEALGGWMRTARGLAETDPTSTS
jgi:hypothetical protein